MPSNISDYKNALDSKTKKVKNAATVGDYTP